MPAQRKPQHNPDADLSRPSEPRKRKDSGFAARGEGIRVQGDMPFDPYRFQTFEVTPAFRQRVLEAQLPLLEPRNSFLELPPESHQRRHAGANDTTIPDIADGTDAGLADPAVTTNPSALAAPSRLATGPSAAVETTSLPQGRWLVAGALLLVVLGFVGTYVAMRGAPGFWLR